MGGWVGFESGVGTFIASASLRGEEPSNIQIVEDRHLACKWLRTGILPVLGLAETVTPH
jgi:hypothetical protein